MSVNNNAASTSRLTPEEISRLFNVFHNDSVDWREISRYQFEGYFDHHYNQLVTPITDPRFSSGNQAIEFFANLYNLWDEENKRPTAPLEYGQPAPCYRRQRVTMMHMVDGLKNYNLERRRSSRGKEYLSEVTTMQNVLWAGFSSLHLMGYVQAQSGTYHCGVPVESLIAFSFKSGAASNQLVEADLVTKSP